MRHDDDAGPGAPGPGGGAAPGRLPQDRSPLGLLTGAGHALAGVAMLAMMAMIAAEVICRGFLGFSLLLVDEVGGYLLVAILFLGAADAFRTGSLLRVDYVFAALSGRPRLALSLAFNIGSLVFAVLLDRALIRQVESAWDRGTQAPTLLATPLWLPQIVMPLGASLLVLALLGAVIADAMALAGRGPGSEATHRNGEGGA
ncbi:MAG: TRAP transporter small permease [Pseudomonadota bacterium]|nr:TRAP transporter small permease [Pseudomonadota bacterium]